MQGPRHPPHPFAIRISLLVWLCLTLRALSATGPGTNQPHWAFQPVAHPALPAVKQPEGMEHPVDRFLQAQREQHGLTAAPQADPAKRLRRLSFVLTGLPPSPEELAAFLKNSAPEAYERQVDLYLNSPRFGERWARHWMDLVRYCESHGSQGDPELPMAWRYRDYLIRAFNADVPYNQFVKEHIAGDLLPSPRLNTELDLNESILGTAQLRMVELGYVPVDALDDQVKAVDNQIDVLSKTFLALTVSCARCHDHKFDPVSQKDFYALYGVLASSRPGQVVVDSPALRSTNRAALAEIKASLRTGLIDAWMSASDQVPAKLRDSARHKDEINRLERERDALSLRLRELEAKARQTLSPQKAAWAGPLLPEPLARWDFESDLRDQIGSMHGKAEGGASLRGGRLVLKDNESWAVTAPLPVDVREKTLEVWVTLDTLEQKGVGPLTLQTPDSAIFDSIVFGEREAGHWMAGSDFFRRTRDVGGPQETAKPNELVQMAIVYGTNDSITVYRNGTPYGQSYTQGTLTTFAAGSARVVLGKRHLTAGIPSFLGEIEEARLYNKALTARQISDLFNAGVPAVSPEAVAAALSPKDRKTWTTLRTQVASLRAREASLRTGHPAGKRWEEAFSAAAKEESHPLHPWTLLASRQGDSFRDGWNQWADRWKQELSTRREFNRTNASRQWTLRQDGAKQWFLGDPGTRARSANAGEFSVEISGDRVVRGLYPSGVYSHLLTRKEPGVLTSPRFKIDTASISIRALGEHSMARLVVENYPIGAGGIYPARVLDNGDMRWVRLDTAYRKGAYGYLEFVTSEDFANPGLRSGGRPYEDGRALFGASDIAFHDSAEPPKETILPLGILLNAPPPSSPKALAERYAQLLKQALTEWRQGQLSDEQLSFLDSFVRAGLLPVTLDELPQLNASVSQYRKLEAEIPVPRRAPGVHEAVAFDQALFQRGQINRPAEDVPRRGLEILGGHPYPTPLSGRLELAEELSAASNPLTSRVMVNRIWHHVFGRGLVGTVDNFGRLGDKPTHPELLDFLATRFIEEGWSVKKLIRQLVTSKAFQQASTPTETSQGIDPGNEFLSHSRIRRLEAEAIRDAILSTTGDLDTTMYGPGVHVYYVGKTEGGGPRGPLDGNRRRSVYQRIRRNAHNPFLEAFDAPKPASTRGKRDATNVPAQSLTLLNDPFVIEQSARWAKSLIAEGKPREPRIHSMFLKALGRAPSADELSGSLEYLTELAAEHPEPGTDLEKNPRVWQDFAQSLFCLKEFIYVD